MATVHQRLRLKQTPTDVWSIRERLCLASSVSRSGDQNWVSVSRAIKPFGEPNRPQDWFSQKNCALQYSDLLEKVETPNTFRRKRGDRDLETPGEFIVRKLTQERIEELEKLIVQDRSIFKKLKTEIEQVCSGEADDQLKRIWDDINEEKKKQEKEVENFRKWLLEREATKQVMQAAFRIGKVPLIGRKTSAKRGIRQLPDQGSELDASINSPPGDLDSCVDEPLVGSSTLSVTTCATLVSPTTIVTQPSPNLLSSHHSPLLNTLLRSSSHVSQPAIQNVSKEISPRSQPCITSPTISSLLSSSPNIPTSIASSVANLLTTALSGPPDHDNMMVHPRPPITSPSQGAPTLLKLLDMPLGAPGKLPPLPVFASLPSTYACSTPAVTTVAPSLAIPLLTTEISSSASEIQALNEVSLEIPSCTSESTEETLVGTIKEAPIVEIVATEMDLVVEDHGDTVVEVVAVGQEVTEMKEQLSDIDLHEEEVFSETVQCMEDDLHSKVGVGINEEKEEMVPAEDEQCPPNSSVVLLEEITESGESSDAHLNISKLDLQTTESSKPDLIIEDLQMGSAQTAAEVDDKETSSLSDSGIVGEKDLSENLQKASTSEDEDDENDCTAQDVAIAKANDSTLESCRIMMDRGGRRRGGRWRRGRRQHGRRQHVTNYEVDGIKECTDEEKTQGKTLGSTAAKEMPAHGEGEEMRPKKNVRRKKEEKEDEADDEDSGNKQRKCKEQLKKEEKKEEELEKLSESKMKEEQSIESLGRETDEESKDGMLGRSLLNVDSIPNSPASVSISGDDPESVRDYKLWKKAIMLVWRTVANHKYANVFLHPVTEEMAPGYHIVVYRPMDLMTIKKNIENGAIKTTAEFQRDVMLMFQNAIMYNNSDHDVYKMAIEMQKEVVVQIKDFLHTQLIVQSTGTKMLRRETREHSQKRGDAITDVLQTPIISQMQSDGDLKRKRTSNSESESGKTKKRRTRADD